MIDINKNPKNCFVNVHKTYLIRHKQISQSINIKAWINYAIKMLQICIKLNYKSLSTARVITKCIKVYFVYMFLLLDCKQKYLFRAQELMDYSEI